MIPVTQTKTEGLGGGNCVAACIASIFEVTIESVDVSCGGSYSKICEWTDHNYPGLHAVSLEYEKPKPFIDGEGRPAIPPTFIRSYWISSIPSPRTTGAHCVVMHGSECVWDPYPGATHHLGNRLLVRQPVEIWGMLFWVVRDPSKLLASWQVHTPAAQKESILLGDDQ